MGSFFALTGIAVVLFASTNIDDIFVLVGFFADAKFRARDVVLGQYAGIAAIFCLSLAACLVSLVIPAAYFGLLGVCPIVIGFMKLFALFRKRARTAEDFKHRVAAGGRRQATTVALVTFASGGDNVAIYTPSFALRSAYEIAVIALVFSVMVAFWCLAASALVNHPKWGSPIRRHADWITPIVFIGMGVLILYQAGSFGLFHHGA
jgi:cadmium resistance protein CadD (predicted permease)